MEGNQILRVAYGLCRPPARPNPRVLAWLCSASAPKCSLIPFPRTGCLTFKPPYGRCCPAPREVGGLPPEPPAPPALPSLPSRLEAPPGSERSSRSWHQPTRVPRSRTHPRERDQALTGRSRHGKRAAGQGERCQSPPGIEPGCWER